MINENDCISVDELKFGDNDVLSALVSSLTKSNLLVLLSTIPGLMNLDTGEVIHTVDELSETIMNPCPGHSKPNRRRRHGLKTQRGSHRHGFKMWCIHRTRQGTRYLAQAYRWRNEGHLLCPPDKQSSIAETVVGLLPQKCRLYRDRLGERKKALVESGKSLLARGVTQVEGDFEGRGSDRYPHGVEDTRGEGHHPVFLQRAPGTHWQINRGDPAAFP